MKPTKNEKALLAELKSLAGALEDVLRSHGASMTSEKFTERYTKLHKAKMVMSRWTTSRK